MLESLGWFAGTVCLHVLGLAATVGLFAVIFRSAGVAYHDLPFLIFLEDNQLSLMAGEQFVFVLAVLILATWRLRGQLGIRLSSRPLPLEHFFLLTCLVIPLSTLSTHLHRWGMEVWPSVLAAIPYLKVLNLPQSMDLLSQQIGDASWPALLLLFAAAPALGEEIIFRGVIGRGLTRRLGVLSGVLMTSILFAVAHGHPVHALAVFPIGVVLHYVYLTTRSFWAPLYLHFGLNSFAIMRAHHSIPAPDSLSTPAALTITLSLLLFLAFLWTTRVRCLGPDGEEWRPSHAGLELPIEMPVTMAFSTLPWRLTLGGLVPLIGFFAVIRLYG